MKNSYIEIKNASEHNLKNVSLKIPRNKFVVITGLSGSGKSSLAFDTLYAEGQRRYVESLSAYARQFLGRIKKPAVENIKGLPPAIAIEQKTSVTASRSTVGTATEIYDYLKLLFARIGKTFSPVSGKEVKHHFVEDVVKFIENQNKGDKITVLSPIVKGERSFNQLLVFLQRQGFMRIEAKFEDYSETFLIDDLLENQEILDKVKEICLVVDRFRASQNADTLSRAADSVQTAFFEGAGICRIKVENQENTFVEEFSNKFEADGIEFQQPSVLMFNFNNPVGACEVCNGFGTTIGIDEDLVIPNKSLSVYEGAVACWKGEKLSYYQKEFIRKATTIGFPVHRPYNELTEKQKELLWEGTANIVGINKFFRMIEREQHKIQNRVLLSRFRGKTICPSCKGSRLKKEASYVKINGKSITDLVLLQLSDLKKFFENLKLTDYENQVAKTILTEIRTRIDYMCNVGLGYLTLNRTSSTLSGGEMQRINLATALGSSLVGSLYVLDEPTVGLHPRDTEKLVKVLKNLQKQGNTVLVVEHDRNVIENAQMIIDLGPLAGQKGGEVVFTGTYEEILNASTLTADYLTGRKKIKIPETRRKPSKSKGFITIKGARQNNLKNIDITIPLGVITAITGVSGSGKSSLIKEVFFPAVLRKLGIYSHSQGKFDAIEGDFDKIHAVEFVDQRPLGRSSRSNPATYLKVYDDIRKLFATRQAAKINGLTPGHFSFNVDGGRCDECQGEGYITIEMQFMADVTMVCESCGGKRFKDEVLEITFKDKNIYDVLEMTIDEAIEFFSDKKNVAKNDRIILENIVKRLKILEKTGLGYVKLGQSTSTLSGGETQRLKLASFIATENSAKPTIFIFDEPTVGLHFDDVNKLLTAFNELVDKGHTVIFIEHNTDMIEAADYVIDLGPEGGKNGGEILFTGTPEELKNCKKSKTAKFIFQNQQTK